VDDILPKIDETDRQLLWLLQQDARRTNKELAEELGIAQSTCLERVRNLRSSGVLRGYHADVDLDALGRSVVGLVSVRLSPKTADTVRGFQQAMLELADVLVVYVTAGEDDFIVEVAVGSVHRLFEFVLDHISNRAEVTYTRTALVYEYTRKNATEPIAPSTTPAVRRRK
jgi:DNA-binding Lrp family transcriptional regulator